MTGSRELVEERVNRPNHLPPRNASRSSLDRWFKEVDALLAEQREYSISPSECDEEPEDGVTTWSLTFRELQNSIGPLLSRLTDDPGRWILVIEIDEAHDHFLRFVAYEDGSLVVETLGNKYLQGAYRLSEGQIIDLAAIGWHEPIIGGRATWAFTEATHSPEIDEVCDRVIRTLRRVFKSAVTDTFLMKLSSVSDRGETAASEQPLVSPETIADNVGIDPLSATPHWNKEEVGNIVMSARSIVDLGHPQAEPGVPAITLYLEIDENVDDDDEYLTCSWNFGISEEDAGFGEAQIENGLADDSEEAMSDCWEAVVAYLRRDGYSDQQILESIS
jgi:hypothetical protein